MADLCETALGAEVGLALGVGHLGEAGQGGGGREALRVVGEVEGDPSRGGRRGAGMAAAAASMAWKATSTSSRHAAP